MATNKLQFDITAKDRTKRAFSAIKKGLGGISKAVLNFKTALVAAVGVAGIGLLIRQSLVSIDKIGKLSRQLFISTEDLGAFRLAADLGGTSLEAFSKGARTMGVGINDWLVKGVGIAKEAFEQLGITEEQIIATNGDLFAQFQLAADGLNKLEAGVEKTAIAYKLFGGRNIELLTAIEGGAAGIQNIREEAERFGLVLSSEMVKRVEDANDAITRMKMRITGLVDNITVALAPAFEVVANGLGRMFDGFMRNQGGVENFSEVLVTKMLQAVSIMVKMLGNAVLAIERFMTKIQDMIRWTGLFDNGINQLEHSMTQWEKRIEGNNEQIKFLEDALAGGLIDVLGETQKKIDDLNAENLKFEDQIEATKNKVYDLTRAFEVNNDTGHDTFTVFKNIIGVLDGLIEQINEVKVVHRHTNNAMKNDSEELVKNEEDVTSKLKKIYASYYKFQQIEAMKAKDAKIKLQEEWKTHMEDSTMRALQAAGQLNKKAFEAYQRFAIGKAIMDTYQAAMAAYAKFGGWPFGAMAAAATIADGMAKVAIIRSQTYSGKAMGGNVKGGSPYMVGEQGREMFVPNQDGSIVPNNELGKNVYITFNIDTVDAGGFDRLLVQRRAMIVNMINGAVNEQGKGAIV